MMLPHHFSLAVTDAGIAAAFLGRWLSMTVCAEFPEPDGCRLLHLRDKDGRMIIELIERAAVKVCDDVHIGVHVADFEVVLERLQVAGVELLEPPRRVGSERICFIALPPDGWRIELNDGLEGPVLGGEIGDS